MFFCVLLFFAVGQSGTPYTVAVCFTKFPEVARDHLAAADVSFSTREPPAGDASGCSAVGVDHQRFEQQVSGSAEEALITEMNMLLRTAGFAPPPTSTRKHFLMFSSRAT